MTGFITNSTNPYALQATQATPPAQSLCSRLAYGAANCVKRLGLGIASASIMTPLQVSHNLLASYAGLLPEISVNDSADLRRTIEQMPGGTVAAVLHAPIFEELLFRGLLQDVLLTRIPKYALSKISPGSEKALDSNVAIAARIVFTSAAFSLMHLVNQGILPNSVIANQLLSTFVVGIGLGIIKEKIGFLGAIGAHIAHNSLSMMAADSAI